MRKKIVSLFVALLAASALFAQTQEQILARMDRETARFDKEGFSMVMEFKIPLLGTYSSTVHTFGEKSKAILEVKGEKTIIWSDNATTWQYDSSKNEITIDKVSGNEQKEADNNVKALNNVTEGYDVKLKKEEADAWHFRCTKSKTNPDKDAPKTMDLTVSKTTYLPVSLKVSQKGVTVTLRDFTLGTNEQDVTFDAAQYPGATIIDKR